jgi:hypothetical protein
MPRKRSWTDDELRKAVAQASMWGDVGPLLGLDKTAGSRIGIRVRIAELGLDTEHLDAAARRDKSQRARELRAGAPRRKSGRRRQNGYRWDPEEFRAAVANSVSYAEALRRLGCQPGGSTYVQFKQQLVALGVDTSHMKGKGWARGRTRPELSRRMNRPLEEILVENSDYLNTHQLKKRLLDAGVLGPRCYCCGITEWNGRPAPLQLDHINGDRRDNRLENLRLLCPNCHAQTDTWCGKNVGAYDVE